MIIQKDANDWSFSTEEQNGLWHLIYDNNNYIIALFESIGITSTQENLFVGTKGECDQYIVDNNLVKIPVVEAPLVEEILTEDAPTEETVN